MQDPKRTFKTRRRFLSLTLFGSLSAFFPRSLQAKERPVRPDSTPGPVLLSTWKFGLKANQKGLEVLANGGTALDAVEQGVRVIEADPQNTTVGIGGNPDRSGQVTLDASIMDWTGNAGSVCYLQDILHPVSVARKIMEETPHVMLAGQGAREFALEQGFQKVRLLTPNAKKLWKEWKESAAFKPIINIENHDTIGMLALDEQGRLSGACTTSGLAYKLNGRVGDSPIIGAGLFVDNEVGGAVATGLGEAVLKTLGSFLIVETMRRGASPQEACEYAIRRIIEKVPGHSGFQVGFLALNRQGEVGACALHKDFSYCRSDHSANQLHQAPHLLP